MAEETLKDKTAKGLFWGGISNGIQQLLNVLFGLILARILDANDYGMVGMLAIFTAIASTIQESGFTSALTNQKEIRHEDYNAVFWFSVLTGISFYIILFFCAPLIANFYDKPELVNLSRVVFLGFLVGGFGIASNAYLFKTLMTKERAKIDVASSLVSGIVGIILAINGYAYTGLAIQATVYVGIGSFLKLYYAPWHPTFQIDFLPLRKMFNFSSKLILTNIFTQINNNIFSVIIGKFYNPTQLGYYSQGLKWKNMGDLLIGGVINNIAQPVLVQVSGEIERQRKVFRKLVRFGAFISFPTMLGLAFIAKDFISILLGEKWLPSVPFLQVFCLWGAVAFLWLLYTNLLLSHNKSNVYLYGVVSIGLVQLVLIIFLLPLGIYQMVFGYIISYYIALLYWHYNCNKILKISLFVLIKDMFPYLLFSILSIMIAYLITNLFFNIYIVLILKILITASVYVFLLWYFDSVIFKELFSFVLRRINHKVI